MVVFDPAKNTWDTTKCRMNAKRRGHALAVLDGELHAIGGNVSSALFAERYDRRADRWIAVPEMALPFNREWAAAALKVVL